MTDDESSAPQEVPCRRSADCVRFDGCPSCRPEDYAW